jgi:uncharacterized protein (TIGR03067 family)
MFLAVSFLAAANDPKAGASGELLKLNGAWKITSVEREGQKIDDFTNTQLSVKDAILAVSENGKLLFEGAVKLDPSKTPKAIDWSIDGGDGKSLTALGIYALDGDNLKFCWSQPGKERPAGFVTKAGSREMVIALKRDK